MSTLKANLMDQIKTSMKAGDKSKLAALRLISAAVKQEEVDTRAELDDASIIKILEKMKKQRTDSIEQYTKAQREDLVAQESYEISVIGEFLPAQLTQEELHILVQDAINAVGAKAVSDISKVMEILKPAIAGKASAKDVGELIRKLMTA